MLHHSGLAYANLDELLACAVPHLEEAIRAKRPAIVVNTAENNEAITRALGGEREGIVFAESRDWYGTQARALTRYMKFWAETQASGAQELHIIGEPVQRDAHVDDISRWIAFESAINASMKEMPIWMTCCYDLRITGVQAADVERSHPWMCVKGAHVSSEAYVDPAVHALERASTRPPAGENAIVQGFDAGSLSPARAFVGSAAQAFGLDEDRASDLVFASGEAIANTVEHGGGHGTIRVWRTAREVVCDVESYSGKIADETFGYLGPGIAGERGRGIWMMRQLCDWVDLWPAARSQGSLVRLHMRLAEEAGVAEEASDVA